ncbi:beta-galactosidase [Rathayibacter sp. CAU 1779]
MSDRWIRWPKAMTEGRRAGNGLAYGGDYNPEQWDEAIWHEDVRLMREAGVTLVTVGVFAWSALQPEPDRWTFDWLDRVLDLLGENEIAVDLATATASTPSWVTTSHPDVLAVDRYGHTMSQGGRQAWSPSSRVYRALSLELVERMAERYGRHEALALWHVSNELGGHNAHDYGNEAAIAFRLWLRDRYDDSLAALNDAWQTLVWSQRYSSWEEILPPRATFTDPNPTQQLDFERFSSDQLRAQLRAEADILRRITPDVPITTNMILFDAGKRMAYSTWTDDVDIVSVDHYLQPKRDAYPEAEFAADRARGLSAGAPWMLMETAPGHTSWRKVNPAKRPGQLRRDVLGHLARGSDTVCFFQWRAARAGAERFHSAMLPHGGADSDQFRATVSLGRDVAACAEMAGSRVLSDAALVFSEESWWALERTDHPHNGLALMDIVLPWHGVLTDLGLTVDVVPPTADLSAYRRVVAPQLYLVDDRTAASLTAVANRGATVVIGAFSGIVDEFDQVRLGGYPGAFRELLGIRVDDFWPMLDEEAGRADGVSGGAAFHRWAERLSLHGADVESAATSGDLIGMPVVTRRRTETGGSAWYVAAEFERDGLAALFTTIVEETAIRVPRTSSPALRVVTRRGEADYHVMINHGVADATVVGDGVDLLDGSTHDGIIVVPGGDVRVVRGTVPRAPLR